MQRSYGIDFTEKIQGGKTMNAVNFEPTKAEAMIHSLHEKHEVFIVFYDGPNNVKAVYNNNGLYYVDDIYGVIDTLETATDRK